MPTHQSNIFARSEMSWTRLLTVFAVVMGLFTSLSTSIAAAGRMYWTEAGGHKIRRANLDGTGVQDLVTTGVVNPHGIALDLGSGKMYWTDFGTGKIQRANLDGSGAEDLMTGLSIPVGIALELRSLIRVPADRPTIQQAIDSAAAGDTILVAPGTYYENIDFRGKTITVTSEGGKAVTVIDGSHRAPAASFTSGEGPATVLSGFTLQNGFGSFEGGGIKIANSSPTITHNVIVNNRACRGAGISISFGSPLIQRNTIINNAQAGCTGGIGGGGISIGGASTAQIVENVISGNVMTSASGGGISLFAAGTPTIRGNTISGNTATGLTPCAQGGGISMVNISDALIVGNLITRNTAGCGGGVFWAVPSGARTLPRSGALLCRRHCWSWPEPASPSCSGRRGIAASFRGRSVIRTLAETPSSTLGRIRQAGCRSLSSRARA